MNTTTCNTTVNWATSERCGAPADHTWIGRDGDTYHECPDHSTHTVIAPCPCDDVPEVEVGPYTVTRSVSRGRYPSDTKTITVTATGEKIRTRSDSPFLLVCGGKIVARAYTTKTRDKWNRDWDAPVGLVVDMRGSK